MEESVCTHRLQASLHQPLLPLSAHLPSSPLPDQRLPPLSPPDSAPVLWCQLPSIQHSLACAYLWSSLEPGTDGLAGSGSWPEALSAHHKRCWCGCCEERNGVEGLGNVAGTPAQLPDKGSGRVWGSRGRGRESPIPGWLAGREAGGGEGGHGLQTHAHIHTHTTNPAVS